MEESKKEVSRWKKRDYLSGAGSSCGEFTMGKDQLWCKAHEEGKGCGRIEGRREGNQEGYKGGYLDGWSAADTARRKGPAPGETHQTA